MKMEEVSMSSLDNSKLEGLAQDILSDLVEDACLGMCFEVHRAVKQGYFFLDDTEQESMRDFAQKNNTATRSTTWGECRIPQRKTSLG
ncbi:hypothetical protein CRUP_005601, partial [Coryphaenoides rupestris]